MMSESANFPHDLEKGEHFLTGAFHAGVYADEKRKELVAATGKPWCDYCDGTGNELYGMYRACPKCAGSGFGTYPKLTDGFRWIPEDWHAGLEGDLRCPMSIEIDGTVYSCVGAADHRIEDHLLRYVDVA